MNGFHKFTASYMMAKRRKMRNFALCYLNYLNILISQNMSMFLRNTQKMKQ